MNTLGLIMSRIMDPEFTGAVARHGDEYLGKAADIFGQDDWSIQGLRAAEDWLRNEGAPSASLLGAVSWKWPHPGGDVARLALTDEFVPDGRDLDEALRATRGFMSDMSEFGQSAESPLIVHGPQALLGHDGQWVIERSRGPIDNQWSPKKYAHWDVFGRQRAAELGIDFDSLPADRKELLTNPPWALIPKYAPLEMRAPGR